MSDLDDFKKFMRSFESKFEISKSRFEQSAQRAAAQLPGVFNSSITRQPDGVTVHLSGSDVKAASNELQRRVKDGIDQAAKALTRGV